MNVQQYRRGFTLVEIMIVCAIISMLAALALPNYVRARSQSQQKLCLDNLRQIDGAKQQWGLEQGKSPSDTALESELASYLGRNSQASNVTFWCPASGASSNSFASSYDIKPLDTPPTCKIDPVKHTLN